MKHKKMIVLTAGGTGGHVYPADALSCELERRGYEVSLFTDFRGLNNYKGKKKLIVMSQYKHIFKR